MEHKTHMDLNKNYTMAYIFFDIDSNIRWEGGYSRYRLVGVFCIKSNDSMLEYNVYLAAEDDEFEKWNF